MTKAGELTATTTFRQPNQPAGSGASRYRFKWIWLPPLGYLWFRLVENLWLEWTTNPQYGYGLVVPLLAVGLLLRRWHHAAGCQICSAPGNPRPAVLWFAALAFFYLPTRLIEAATPEWRPITWALGIETTGLTLAIIYLVGGNGWLRQAAFPVAFILVAVPWPSPIENPIIQGLSRINATLVVQGLFVLNVPTIQHGNIIEVGNGFVGINDACSGIRSCQSSLMISLFLGEFYRFGWRLRLLLLPTGLATAMILNVCRTSLLTWLAATRGVSAIAEYHDEAGLTILLAGTAVLWGLGWWLKRHFRPEADPTTIGSMKLTDDARNLILRRVSRLGIILIIWLVVVESSVALWFLVRESRLQPGPNWSVKLPRQNPTYKDLPVTKEAHDLLRFDQGQQGEWRESDGTVWQAFYYNWLPGRVAGYLAKRHTPDICMTATGYNMTSGPELLLLNVNNVELPIRHYIFASSSGPLQVYQCHWEAGVRKSGYTADESSRFNLIRGIWAGRGNHGQKVLEIIITGYDNAEVARKALVTELNHLIEIEK